MFCLTKSPCTSHLTLPGWNRWFMPTRNSLASASSPQEAVHYRDGWGVALDGVNRRDRTTSQRARFARLSAHGKAMCERNAEVVRLQPFTDGGTFAWDGPPASVIGSKSRLNPGRRRHSERPSPVGKKGHVLAWLMAIYANAVGRCVKAPTSVPHMIDTVNSTQSKDGKRDSAMHQSTKVNQHYFGAKAHMVLMTSQTWFAAWWSQRSVLQTSHKAMRAYCSNSWLEALRSCT